MKKLLAVFLALMMILSVSLMACSDKKENVNKNEEKTLDYVKKYTGFWGSIRRELKKRL